MESKGSFKFNPDYLKFQDGVNEGRKLEREELGKKFREFLEDWGNGTEGSLSEKYNAINLGSCFDAWWKEQNK